MSTVHIADTGVFVAVGDPSDERYRAVRRFARRNDVTFVVPKRVYEESTVTDLVVEHHPWTLLSTRGGFAAQCLSGTPSRSSHG